MMTDMTSSGGNSASADNFAYRIFQWLFVFFLIYLLITAVGMIGSGFKGATKGHAAELFSFATNPFMGLIVGVMATAMIQSSSTVTSIIVGMVAGGLPVEMAVPMIMGANIGTTITNTIVSLGHVRHKKEFRRAFAAATVHDFFNLMAVAIFLPIEIIFHPLQKIATYLSEYLVGGENLSVKGLNFIKPITKPVITEFQTFAEMISVQSSHILLVFFGIAIIFLSIIFIGKLLKKLMVGRAKKIMHASIGRGPISGITSGAIVTVLVQSSSTTTSLMVPLAGAGVFKLKQIYPFTLGANIGTTITALLAATAISGPTAILALQIALVHLLYNTSAVAFIYGIKTLRKIPIRGALWLARLAAEKKLYALFYLLGIFFVVPGVLIFLHEIFA